MYSVFDVKADAVNNGDSLRDVSPLKFFFDENGLKHYVFGRKMFDNPKYIIPKDHFTLFYNFLNGGSREYPSDGSIPVDVVAKEARIVLEKIKEFAEDASHEFNLSAKKTLNNNENELVRGTVELYFGEYTTRDWRRKRSTDDIDFWISDVSLLEKALLEADFTKNKKTKEWEKKVIWYNPSTRGREEGMLIASNDRAQSMDFGSGSYLDGSSLKDTVKKKIVRGHDVDLSDIINVAIVNNIPVNNDENSPWRAVVEGANMRSSRVTSNIISLCRYSYAIADYLRSVGISIKLYKELVKNPSLYTDIELIKICKCSSHWLKNYPIEGVNATRQRIYNNLDIQKQKKLQYSKNLRKFADNVLKLLNSKYGEVFFDILI